MVSASLRILQWSLERSLGVSDGLWEKPIQLLHCFERSSYLDNYTRAVKKQGVKCTCTPGICGAISNAISNVIRCAIYHSLYNAIEGAFTRSPWDLRRVINAISNDISRGVFSALKI